jgi:predicted RNase H-like nuclease
MPIGLYESGRARMRPCDHIARQRLGKRACCVFIPPTRAMLCAESYAPLRMLGLSVQAYHLIPRIRELDALLTPDLQARVWESHPELSFRAMTGAPIPHPKRTQTGQAARMDALRRALGESGDALASLMAAFRQQVAPKHAGIDDLLDACALAWSALRHTRGESELCLGDPAYDARGLLMAIRY